jgi:hypothetical protein
MAAFAKGGINVTKLLKLMEENKGCLYTSESGDSILKININFLDRDLFNGQNISISLFNASSDKGNLYFGNAKLDYNHLENAGII